MFAVARAPRPGQFGKAQSAKFTNAARNIVSVGDAEFLQVCERDRQFAIVSAAVGGVFDLEPVKDAAAGQTENAKGGRPQHVDPAHHKLPADAMF